jgi:hypothetical protein
MQLDDQLLERIAALAEPHAKALNEAIASAFPDDDPDRMRTIALASQLGVSSMRHALESWCV